MLAGYQVVDVKAHLTFGSYHDVDSSEQAFRMAAIFGFKEACPADPVIPEPIMSVEVETPEDYAGNVMGDLSSRRGLVQGMEEIPGGGGRKFVPRCRCPRCSATRRPCVRCRRAAPPHHGIQPLRRSAAQRGRRDHSPQQALTLAPAFAAGVTLLVLQRHHHRLRLDAHGVHHAGDQANDAGQRQQRRRSGAAERYRPTPPEFRTR